jgi:hypothetical protein
MPRARDLQKFKYNLQEEIFTFLAERSITYREAAEKLGFKTPHGLQRFVNSTCDMAPLRVLEMFEAWKAQENE